MTPEYSSRSHSTPRGAAQSNEIETRMNSDCRRRTKPLSPRVPGSTPGLVKTALTGMRGESLLNAIPDAILILDHQEKIVIANVQAEKLLGYGQEELIGRSAESLIAQKSRAANRRYGQNFFGELRVRPVGGGLMLFLLRYDATEVPVEVNLNPLSNQVGAFLVCSIRDASNRRHVEGLRVLDAVLRETRESEERFCLLADTAPALIWMSDSDKLCIFVNRSWQDLTGRSMESHLGNGWAEAIHPDDLPIQRNTFALAFDNRNQFRTEYRLRRHDGEYRWILTIGMPRFDKDLSFLGYIGIGIDVTDRKLAEAALARVSSKLIEAQEQERTRIARELHDDLGQRLAILAVGLGQLWNALPKTEVEGRAKVQEILNGAKELAADLHSLSHQLHSSKLEHVGLVSALRSLCKEIGEKYKIEVNFTKSEISFAVPKDVALSLFRVAQEALSNIVKHSQAKSACVELAVKGRSVTLRIRDDGKGFDIDQCNEGPGIGVIGMRERLRLVGGQLAVNSQANRGTEVFAEVSLAGTLNAAQFNTQTIGR